MVSFGSSWMVSGVNRVFAIDSTGSNGSKAAQRRRADLSSNRASVSSSATATPSLGKATLSPLSSPKTPLNDKRRSFGSMPLKRRPMLIRNLNKVGTAKGMNFLSAFMLYGS